MNNIDIDILRILEEEIRSVDLATEYSTINQSQEISIIAIENTVVSGINLIKSLLDIIDKDAVIKIINQDGFFIEENDIIAIIKAEMTTIIKLEQLIYNVMETMCAIATSVNYYVKRLADTNIKLIDNRINIPGARYITKLAFLDGGGINHYGNLSDHIFLNAKHKELYGSYDNAISTINNNIDHIVKCTIEIETETDFHEAVNSDCQIITIKNMHPQVINRLLKNYPIKQLVVVNICSKEFEIDNYINEWIDFISINNITEDYSRKKVLVKYIK